MVTSPSTMSTPTIQAACSLTTLSSSRSTLRNVGSGYRKWQRSLEHISSYQPTRVPGQQLRCWSRRGSTPKEKGWGSLNTTKDKNKIREKEGRKRGKLTSCHWRVPVTRTTVLKRIKWMERTEHPRQVLLCCVISTSCLPSPELVSRPATNLPNEPRDQPCQHPREPGETRACSACGGKTLTLR